MTTANHSATEHKVAHNITTICNIPLVFWLIYTVITLCDATYAEFTAYFAMPVNTIAAILFVLCTLKHFALEISVVFEDYISNISLRHFIIIAMKLFFLVLGLTAIISILKIAL